MSASCSLRSWSVGKVVESGAPVMPPQLKGLFEPVAAIAMGWNASKVKNYDGFSNRLDVFVDRRSE